MPLGLSLRGSVQRTLLPLSKCGRFGVTQTVLQRLRTRRWFPVSPATLARAEGWYRHYGRWSLLLAWALIIGDPLTVVAGVLRESFWVFLLLVSVAKIGRYLVLAAATLGFA